MMHQVEQLCQPLIDCSMLSQLVDCSRYALIWRTCTPHMMLMDARRIYSFRMFTQPVHYSACAAALGMLKHLFAYAALHIAACRVTSGTTAQQHASHHNTQHTTSLVTNT
jgi:hypothetical protein